MVHRLLVIMVTGLAFTFVVPVALPELDITTSEASAHPAPYPHRHHYRRAPKRPTYRRTPRRKVETHERRSFVYFAIGALGNTGLGDESQLSQSLDTGGGFNLSLGLRLSQYVALEMTWMSSFHDSANFEGTGSSVFTGITGDAKLYIFTKARRIEPFFQIGLGAYVWNRDGYGSESLGGPGIQAGGGVDIHLNPAVSLGGTILYRGAHLDNRDASIVGFPVESTFLSMLTFGGNVQLHF